MKLTYGKLRQIIGEEIRRLNESFYHGEEIHEHDVPPEIREELEEKLFNDGLIDIDATNVAMPEITWIQADQGIPGTEYYKAEVTPVLGIGNKKLQYTYSQGEWHSSGNY